MKPKYKNGDEFESKYYSSIQVVNPLTGQPEMITVRWRITAITYDYFSNVLTTIRYELVENVYGFTLSLNEDELERNYNFVPNMYDTSVHHSSNTYCDHDYANYVGLFEAFEYCKKCDAKKPEPINIPLT